MEQLQQTSPLTEKSGVRKRKRSRKDDGKRFECSEHGCTKSYSRAEHLYRHQLNHTPKEIFECPYTNCNKKFVRQDLRARHVERHKQRNPSGTTVDEANPVDSDDSGHTQSSETEVTFPTWQEPLAVTNSHSTVNRSRDSLRNDLIRDHGPSSASANVVSPSNTMFHNERLSDNFRNVADHNSHNNKGARLIPNSSYAESHQDAPRANGDAHNNAATRSPSVPETTRGFGSHFNQEQYYDHAHSDVLSPSWQSQPNQYVQNHYASRQTGASEHRSSATFEGGLQNAGRYAIPSAFDQSPYADTNDFELLPEFDFLFAPQSLNDHNFGMFGEHIGYLHDLDPSAWQGPPPPSQPSPMALSSIIDPTLPELDLSAEKRKKLIDIMVHKFNDDDQAPEHRHDRSFFDGLDDDHLPTTHPLSLSMMRTYIGSYWVHFNTQVPIIHRPTFSPDHCEDLLLMSMMIIGASALEPLHGRDITEECAKLSEFLAWHLRWALFRHECARPPAKLWVFQALLLLEFYEKMYATRELHERGHIHHDTTITLMRRGSFLAGTSPAPLARSVAGTSSRDAGTEKNQWWDHWIAKECTTRAIFAAFVMDTLHAISFGHSAMMAVHDMKIPLPCDENMWSATNASEVQRIERSLQNNGFKPPTFLDALRRTLSRKHVKTNSFGRTIIMAGLLSVAWHLNQRDLQLSSVGVQKFPTGREKWRLLMSRAFTCWKEDFDEAIQQIPVGQRNRLSVYRGVDDENLFESRVVMFHLAHMAMHTDVVDVQTYAGAKQLLGRDVTTADIEGAKYRIERVWAQSPRAREATFHALKFMLEVLVPEDGTSTTSHLRPHHPYSARDDFLLHRPWILYFAALTIWCFGYANDGPHGIDGLSESNEARRLDMIKFLRRVGGISNPDELQRVERRSSCVGMMMHLRDLFRDTRWELLHEAADLLDSCIMKTIRTPAGSGSS